MRINYKLSLKHISLIENKNMLKDGVYVNSKPNFTAEILRFITFVSFVIFNTSKGIKLDEKLYKFVSEDIRPEADFLTDFPIYSPVAEKIFINIINLFQLTLPYTSHGINL